MTLDRLPRMADFALGAVAVERALGWPAGSFLDAYMGNRASARESTLEDSLIAPLIRRCAEEGGFVGRAGELLRWLEDHVDEQARRRNGWPKKANVLSGLLRRLMPDLRAAGWAEVELRPRTGKAGRQIVIRKVGESIDTIDTIDTAELENAAVGVDQGPGGVDVEVPGVDPPKGLSEYAGVDGVDGVDPFPAFSGGTVAGYPEDDPRAAAGWDEGDFLAVGDDDQRERQ